MEGIIIRIANLELIYTLTEEPLDIPILVGLSADSVLSRLSLLAAIEQ
jgi:hypothetical protein